MDLPLRNSGPNRLLYLDANVIPVVNSFIEQPQDPIIRLLKLKNIWDQFFIKDFIYFREGREGERKGEKHQCAVASHVPLVGDLTCNPVMCPDWELTWRPFGSQASAQSTEPHQPGPEISLTLNSLSFVKAASQSSYVLFELNIYVIIKIKRTIWTK